jgi:hypothetical protein
VVALALVAACGQSAGEDRSTRDAGAVDASAPDAPVQDAAQVPGCPTNQALPGASYDITKSRFAFGGKPVETTVGTAAVRWSGPDGGVAIFSNGSEAGTLSADAPEGSLPPATTDFATAVAYARDYYVTMGLPACQAVPGLIDSWVHRAINGIPVFESVASATFDIDNQTTSEQFYWPEIPANVVIAAIAFQQKISGPEGLAAYKSKLPEDAQGDGQVMIHHSVEFTCPFQALTTYDVLTSGDAGDGDATLSFDADGNPVTLPSC